jgi:NAD(P)-dependent dehydrogenase (short-subunit alcohol dehydrogenase family)
VSEMTEARVVVTGAAQGIGQAIAAGFARDGGRVAGIDMQTCEDTARLCGPGFRAFDADVADYDAVAGAFQEIDDWFAGAPTVLCNVAATYAMAPFLETPVVAFDRVMAVNVRGAFLCCQQAARRMAAAGGGRIVNVTSTESVQAFALASAYGASKAALAHLTKSAAVELADHSILVNAVAPGAIDTPSLRQALPEMPAAARHDLERTPIRRLGTPEDVVAAVRFLASEATWTTGQTIYVDGGFLAAGLPLLAELRAAEQMLPASWFGSERDADE